MATAVYLLVVETAGAYIPTPLYPGYEQAFGFSDLVLTLVYALFALVSMPALLVAGPIRDALGSRVLLWASLGLAAAGSGCFLLAQGPTWLLGGRVLQGLALGAVTVAATTLITERARSGRSSRASLGASLAFVAGTAAGPIGAGLAAQYVPAPFATPYLAHLGLLALGAVALSRLARPAHPRGRARTLRWTRPGVPHGMRATFAAAAGAGFLAWCVAGVFLALIPSLLHRYLHTGNPALAGAVVGLVLVCSGLTQLATARTRAATAQTVGTLLLLAGLAVLLLGRIGLTATVIAAVLAGIGHGLAYRGATATVDAATPEARRGAVTAALYVAFYLGTGLPTIVVGLLTLAVPLLTAVTWLAAGVLGFGVLTTVGAIWAARASACVRGSIAEQDAARVQGVQVLAHLGDHPATDLEDGAIGVVVGASGRGGRAGDLPLQHGSRVLDRGRPEPERLSAWDEQ